MTSGPLLHFLHESKKVTDFDATAVPRNLLPVLNAIRRNLPLSANLRFEEGQLSVKSRRKFLTVPDVYPGFRVVQAGPNVDELGLASRFAVALKSDKFGQPQEIIVEIQFSDGQEQGVFRSPFSEMKAHRLGEIARKALLPE